MFPFFFYSSNWEGIFLGENHLDVWIILIELKVDSIKVERSWPAGSGWILGFLRRQRRSWLLVQRMAPPVVVFWNFWKQKNGAKTLICINRTIFSSETVLRDVRRTEGRSSVFHEFKGRGNVATAADEFKFRRAPVEMNWTGRLINPFYVLLVWSSGSYKCSDRNRMLIRQRICKWGRYFHDCVKEHRPNGEDKAISESAVERTQMLPLHNEVACKFTLFFSSETDSCLFVNQRNRTFLNAQISTIASRMQMNLAPADSSASALHLVIWTRRDRLKRWAAKWTQSHCAPPRARFIRLLSGPIWVWNTVRILSGPKDFR